jgi:tRNA (cmo5U34)-methyltransferase
MESNYQHKSTIEEIRQRFDKDVERFSNLETGQQATMDAPLSLELITDAAQRVNPNAKNLLDIGSPRLLILIVLWWIYQRLC